MVPTDITLAIVEDELRGARAWAGRHGIPLCWVPERLELQAILTQPDSGERFYLRGSFDDYRELPPRWTFTDEQFVVGEEPRFFPSPGQSRFGSSIFTTGSRGPVICVPFNRLAFAEHGGPHSDWGGPSSWLRAGPQYVQAAFIGDMLQVIRRDVLMSRGRMG